MSAQKSLIAGNWKMHGLAAALSEIDSIAGSVKADGPDVMICPATTLLSEAAEHAAGTHLQVGAQDCHVAEAGAHTGDVSAAMIKDAGATAVIVGHSERRGDHGETDALVRAKASAALAAGLTAIVCVGETLGQRNYGQTLTVLTRQLAGSVPDEATADTVVIAYEPVWAIGTGLTPTVEDVAAAHAHMRAELTARFGAKVGGAMRLLYGGSVKPGNAGELMSIENVNGALVGGASLKAEDFLGIVSAVA